MKIKNKLCLLITIFMLTGCYNYRELNDLAITTAFGIDKDENGYKMTFQVVNTKKSSSQDNDSGNPKIIVYEQTGKTTQEAARKIILESPKRVYANHVVLLVIDENVAKEGIENVLDLLFRDAESRKQYMVLISKGTTAKEILQTLTPLEAVNAQDILKSIIADSKYYGISEDITLESLMESLINSEKEIIIPSIKLIGNKEISSSKENIESSNTSAKVILGEMAIFKNNKLVGYATEKESIALSYIRGKLKDTIVTMECPNNKDKYFSVELIGVKTKKKASKNKLEVTLDITGNGSIAEIYCDYNLEKIKTINTLEKNLEKHITNEIKNSIISLNNRYQSDIYDFKELFYKTNPKFYNIIKKDYYDKYFNNIKININTDIKLIEKGTITKVIKDEE
ncbi:uncharacterized protein BN775_00507 [Clostridium sp. CAG:762]|nr:uncharacterized protein BN775_00507 [Clostridium sp. CAG:762]